MSMTAEQAFREGVRRAFAYSVGRVYDPDRDILSSGFRRDPQTPIQVDDLLDTWIAQLEAEDRLP